MDSMKPETWFHVSNCSTIESFHPFSHFGTYKAALDRYCMLYLSRAIKKGCLESLLSYTLYECQIQTQDSDTFIFDDWDGCGASALFFDLKNANQVVSEVDYAHYRAIKSDIKNSDLTLDDLAASILSKKFKSLNIKSIKYTNDHEDKGSESLCVIDPMAITIKEKGTHFSPSDIASALPKYIKMLGLDNWKEHDEVLTEAIYAYELYLKNRLSSTS